MGRNFMRIQKGLSFIGGLISNPTNARLGDVFLDETYGALKTYRNGRWIALEEAELIRLARIEEHASDGDRVEITAAEQALPLGQTLTLELSGLRVSFSGAEIDFVTGEVFEDDGSTPLGQDFIPSLPTGTNWRWFSITLIPSTVNADQTINAQILVIPAETEAATKAAAEKPGVASTGKALGFVAIQGDGGGGINAITWDDIDQIAPGGSGGGIGDITDIQTRIDDIHDDSAYQLQTPLVYKVVEDDLTESGTASFSIVDGAYDFEAAENLLTIDLIDYTEFNANGAQDIGEIDVLMFQNLETVDTGFTLEATRDGVNYREVTMERVGETDLWQGSTDFPDDDRSIAAAATLTENDVVGDGGDPLDDIDERWAQSFTLTDDSFITQVTWALWVNTGSPTGNVFCDIHEDNGGVPGVIIATSDPNDIASIGGGATLDDVFSFPSKPILNASDTYWVSVRPSADATLDGSNFFRVQRDGGNPFAGGVAATSADGGQTWGALAGTDALFRVTGEAAPLYFETLDEQTTFSSSIVLNDTTQQRVGQAFDVADHLSLTATKNVVAKRVTLKIDKTEAVAGNLDGGIIRVWLADDDGGSPSTTVVSDSLDIFMDDLSAGSNDVVVDLTELAFEASSTFHIVVGTNDEYKNNLFNSGVDEVAVQSNGTPVTAANVYNGTAWSASTDEAYFVLEGKQVELRLRVTASADMLLNALAVLYDEEDSGFASASRERQMFVFNGSDNKISFEINNFTPDVDRLVMHDPDTGQGFVAGGTQGFILDGRFVEFQTDEFGNGPFTEDRVYVIEARQVEGGSIDDSSTNLALLVANHLGSLDGGVDRSVPGRGIILRAIDGKQYELVIKSGGAGIQIYEVTA